MHAAAKSPFAPAAFPDLPPIPGVRLASAACGAKYRGRDDLMLAEFAPGAVAVGVLARTAVPGAPVQWCRRLLADEHEHAPRALLVNAGQANAFTGEAGLADVRASCEAAAAALGCKPEEVFAASTGVIGEPLPLSKITGAAPQLAAALREGGWESAAKAITTTDTFAKGATARAEICGQPVNINGIAKGSGMIAPNMATLLAFLFTDAAVPRDMLRELLAAANEKTFNSITVDGDASTSDICLLFATGRAGNSEPRESDLDDFRRALDAVMRDLALQVAGDGEGARKLITVEVHGAEDDRAAKAVAMSVANSPLVKTAVAGEDANWGRVVMAVGKAGARIDPARLAVAIGGVTVARGGQRVDDLDEAPLNEHLKGREISIRVDLGLAAGGARVWTCDLTHGYIEINASYRS